MWLCEALISRKSSTEKFYWSSTGISVEFFLFFWNYDKHRELRPFLVVQLKIQLNFFFQLNSWTLHLPTQSSCNGEWRLRLSIAKQVWLCVRLALHLHSQFDHWDLLDLWHIDTHNNILVHGYFLNFWFALYYCLGSQWAARPCPVVRHGSFLENSRTHISVPLLII